MKAKQLSLFPMQSKEFGGHLIKGNPREKRPIATKRAMHVVLKSDMAKNSRSLRALLNLRIVNELVRRLAQKNGIKIYEYANSHNHLHILLKCSTRQGYKKYVRTLSGLVARHILSAEKGRAKLGSKQKFWSARPYTRIVEWGRDFVGCKRYVLKNFTLAVGFVSIDLPELDLLLSG